MLTPSSWAMMWLSVVLPRPGGPNSSTWSIASLRFLAAPIKISSWSRILVWPTYCSKSLGRNARSMASSFGESGAADITRLEGGRSARLKSSVWMVMDLLRQRLQRQLDAVTDTDVSGERFKRERRIAVAVAECHQRLQDVGLAVAADIDVNTDVGTQLALEL